MAIVIFGNNARTVVNDKYLVVTDATIVRTSSNTPQAQPEMPVAISVWNDYGMQN